MAINTQALLDQKASAFGAPSNSSRFTADFMNAVNRTLADMKLLSNLDTTPITDVQTDIDLDEKYESVLSVGVDYHLLMIGQQSQMDKRDTYTMYRDMLKTAQMEYFRDAGDDGTLSVKLGDLSE